MRRGDLCHEVRQRLKRLPAPYDAHYGVVPPPPPETAIAVTRVRAEYEAANAALAGVDALAAELDDPYLVSRVLTRREAVSSSAIEGTNSTLDEILSAEETEDGEVRTAVGAAIRQVRDYASTLDALIPRARDEGHGVFTLDLVQALHRAVMKEDTEYQDRPGDLRTRVVWIGGQGNIAYSTWTPPPPEHVRPCLLETVDYLRNEGMQAMTQGLIMRMAVAHAHFEAVHPFRDGNGRVGRLLWPLMMAADGHVPLYLSPYVEAHKDAYYQALKDAQQRLDWQAAAGFLSEAIVGTVDELMATRKALAELRGLWLARRRFRKGSAALRALDVLAHYPVVTVKRMAGLLDVSVAQASQAVAQLTEAGILKERTGYSRNRIFAASEALSIINRPFGHEPLLPQSRGPGEPADEGGLRS